MKRIVFSFDDGLSDFYSNVFPILKKYKIKATLNVITGFSDKSVESNYDCCSVEQLHELVSYGIEIANHSNDHLSQEPITGYDIAQKKLIKWFPNQPIVGVATPYTQGVQRNFYKWCRQNNIKYVRLGDIDYRFYIQKIAVKMGLVSYFRTYCFNNSHYKKKNGTKIIYSFPVFANKDVDFYKKIVEVCSFNPKITFMFHSLFDSEKYFETCPYPKGAWTTQKFEELVKWALSRKYKICRQCDTL